MVVDREVGVDVVHQLLGGAALDTVDRFALRGGAGGRQVSPLLERDALEANRRGLRLRRSGSSGGRGSRSAGRRGGRAAAGTTAGHREEHRGDRRAGNRAAYVGAATHR